MITLLDLCTGTRKRTTEDESFSHHEGKLAPCDHLTCTTQAKDSTGEVLQLPALAHDI